MRVDGVKNADDVGAALEQLRLAALALAKAVRRSQLVRRPRVSGDVRAQVLIRITRGETHRQIAKALGIGVGTVSKIRRAP